MNDREPWSLESLAGRLVEVRDAGGGAPLAAAFLLVREAQGAGEAAAWATDPAATFHPEDAAACGVDLAALAVARVPGARGVLRAGEILARSGSFALVVLDLGSMADLGADRRLLPAAAARLAAIARSRGCAVLAVARGDPRAPCFGPAAQVRVEARRRRVPGGGFAVAVRGLRDRRGPAEWVRETPVDGPGGTA